MFSFRKTDAKQQREIDDLRAKSDKQAAVIEYLSMMTDVEIPTDEEEVNYEQEV